MAVLCGFYHNCNVDKMFTITLHARLANYTSLPSCMVSYGSVSKLREFNLMKETKMKNFAISSSPLTRAYNNLNFWSVV